MNRHTLELMDRLTDDLTTLVAISALAYLGLQSGADPTTVVGAISGLGGYRLYRGRESGPVPPEPPAEGDRSE